MTLLPWANLWSYAVANGIGTKLLLANITGEHRRQLIRWERAGGMTEQYADRIACALGAHPVDIWPVEWPIIEAEYERRWMPEHRQREERLALRRQKDRERKRQNRLQLRGAA